MPHNPRHVEQLMGAARAGQGRGSQYGYQMSQRPGASTVRSVSNTWPSEGTWWSPNLDTTDRFNKTIEIPPGMERLRRDDGELYFPDAYYQRDYAGSRGGYAYGGLSPEEDMLLKEQGYVDKGGMRDVLDWDTGEVTKSMVGSPVSHHPEHGPRPVRPTSMAERVGGPGASKPGGDWAGMLDAMEKQQYREKYGEESRGGGGGR